MPFRRGERVYTGMEWWTKIRLEVLRGETSKREILRRESIHWETLKKILQYPEPPGYRSKTPRSKPKLGPFLERIVQIIEDDKAVSKKQRHTSKRIYERLKAEGYRGRCTQVKEAVREIKRVNQEVFIPLVHRPGEAQVDFGFAVAKVAGVLRKIAFFVMVLPHSDAFFVMAFERECTETYWEGHERAFEFLGGAPNRISYDNSKVLVSQVLGGGERKFTDGFLKLQSHYLFRERFCRVRRANEKGVEELNRNLAAACREDLKRRLRGKSATKAQLLAEDREAFLPHPAGGFDACRKVPTRANSLSLARFDRNDYSVPVAYAHHEILAKGYVDRVLLVHKQCVVAEHRRSWGKEGVFFNYLHYLPLLERKPGAIDHARPMADLNLPDCFNVLRRRLENEQQKQGDGTREFIRVLRLLEDYPMSRLEGAVEKALAMRVHSRDAIAQFLFPRPLQRSTFLLDGQKHLCGVQVDRPDLTAYRTLLSREASHGQQ